jgi:hypothetical protein
METVAVTSHDPLVGQMLVDIKSDIGKLSSKQDSMTEKQAEATTTLAVIVEQLKDLPDHENRLRRLEEFKDNVPDLKKKLDALDKWRYGLPLTALMAIASVGAVIYQALH